MPSVVPHGWLWPGSHSHAGATHAFLLTPAQLAVGAPSAQALSFAGARPNPVRGQAAFAYSLASPGAVRLALYDVSGRLARTLEDGALGAGPHEAAWDGRDDAGAPVAAGLYFARLESAGASLIRRVSVVR